MPIPPRTPLLSEMRVEQVTANQVRTVLNNTASRLDREIRKMDDSTNPITRMQAETQRRAVQSYMDQDWKDIEKSIASGRVSAAREASLVVSRYENQLLQLVTDKATRDSLAKGEAQRAASGVDNAVRRMQGRSYVPLSKQVYYTQAIADGWIDEVINQGLASGWSQRKIAKAVRDHISPNVPGGVSYAANRLARTEVNNAYHASAAKRYEDSPIVEGIDWHLSSSHPEGDICDSLAAGSPYKKGKVPRKPHPHCYCFLTPALPTDEEFIENLFAGKYGDEPWVSDIKPAKLSGKWDANGDQSLQAAWAKGDPKVLRDLSGDSAADMVKMVQLADGTKAYIKDPGGWSDAVKERMMMNDVLGSRVSQQLGVRGPRAAIVEYDGKRVIMTEAMDARVSYEVLENLDDAVERLLLTGDSGMVDMTFMDYVIANKDRHAGNWLIDSQGKVVSIDLGESFGSYSPAGDLATWSFDSQEPFLAMVRNRGVWEDQLDYTGWKSKLQDLKPYFDEVGRSDSYTAMMARLDDLKKTLETQYGGTVS